MKNTIPLTLSILILCGAVATSPAFAEEKKTADKTDPKMEEMMKKMEAAGTPGTPHKALDPLVGEWKAEVKMWMKPDVQPSVSKATAQSKRAMNGRFVQEDFHGEFMGKPFNGRSFLGYDNTAKRYQSVWMDDTSTAIYVTSGQASEDGKTITLEGSYECPAEGHKQMKQVIRIVSPDKHVFEMHDPSKGDKSKTMEITYTRK